jgi:hypothetical protein
MDSHDSTDVSCFLCNLKSERKLHELQGVVSGEFQGAIKPPVSALERHTDPVAR